MSSTASHGSRNTSDLSETDGPPMADLYDRYHQLEAGYEELKHQFKELSGQYEDLLQALNRERRKSSQLGLQLEHATREAEKSESIQREFLDTMSHELLTPLNGIIGMTHLLNELPLDHEARDTVHTIQQCGEELELILKNILDFVYLSKGDIDIHPSLISLTSNIEEIILEYASDVYEKKLEITYIPHHEESLLIEIDRDRLIQISHILLSNAVKFTQEGHILVESTIEPNLHASTDEQQTHELILDITDTGIGISELDLEHIFLPFHQIDSSKTRDFGGIGMGLTVCKELIGQMNGSIVIKSIPNEGSTFSVSLPIQSISRSKKSVYTRSFKDQSIVLTSFHPPNRELIRQFTTSLDASLTEWHDPEHQKRPDFPKQAVWLIDYPTHTHAQDVIVNRIQEWGTEKPLIVALIPHNLTIPAHQKALFEILIKKPITQKALYDGLAFSRSLVEPQVPDEKPQRGSSSVNSSSESDKEAVLLVDSSPINQKILLHMMGMLNYRVSIISDIEDLKTQLEERSAFTILINPDIDSSADFKELKHLVTTFAPSKEVRMIAIMSRNSRADDNMLQEAGIHEHIFLPTRLEVVADLLKGTSH